VLLLFLLFLFAAPAFAFDVVVLDTDEVDAGEAVAALVAPRGAGVAGAVVRGAMEAEPIDADQTLFRAAIAPFVANAFEMLAVVFVLVLLACNGCWLLREYGSG
jgi:hypothetical protein